MVEFSIQVVQLLAQWIVLWVVVSYVVLVGNCLIMAIRESPIQHPLKSQLP